MKNSVKNKAFLIGNGINKAISNNVKSWEDLLKELSSTLEIDLNNEFKPFPLTFEEILFKSDGELDEKLPKIKEKIANTFTDTPCNNLHSRLVFSGIENILTTNYDYAFEKALLNNFNNEKGKTPRSTKETLNSVKRRTKFEKIPIQNNESNRLNIWHIHGEINQRLYPSELENTSNANSIMIGFEHYGAYMLEIQKYIKGEKSKKDKSIEEKILDSKYKPQSWIDFFFIGELHIAGISYDFSEQHLWWLLNYRAKQIKRGKVSGGNKIFYYYSTAPEVDPGDLTKYAKQLMKKKMNKAKMDIFNSLGVETIPIEIQLNDYKDYYDQIFDKVMD